MVNDREISYAGKITSLSSLAKKLLHRNCGVQGTLHFTYKGEILSALRKRLEDEGTYGTFQIDNTKQKLNITENEENARLLYFTMEKYNAVCRWKDNKFILLKGSQIAKDFTPSCRNDIKNLRKKYSNIISNDNTLLEDIVFTSSSTAASFVTASSKNGKLYWKNQDGVLLRDLIN